MHREYAHLYAHINTCVYKYVHWSYIEMRLSKNWPSVISLYFVICWLFDLVDCKLVSNLIVVCKHNCFTSHGYTTWTVYNTMFDFFTPFFRCCCCCYSMFNITFDRLCANIDYKEIKKNDNQPKNSLSVFFLMYRHFQLAIKMQFFNRSFRCRYRCGSFEKFQYETKTICSNCNKM